MKIQIKKITRSAKLPTRGSLQSAGYDLYADVTAETPIEPHKTKMIGTGLTIALPDGYFGAIYARSGIASKRGLRPANCTGVCDSDYRGEYIVALHNDTDEMQYISPGERIAQLIIQKYEDVDIEEVNDLDETERGSGGFGSTGKG